MPSGNPNPATEFLPLGAPGVDAAGCGPKAARLSGLLRLGLPVLPGVVWTSPEPPAGERLRTLEGSLPGPWILRSSGRSEDSAASSFAGCFCSVGPVDLSGARDAFARVLKVPEAARVVAALAGVPVSSPAVLIQPWRAFACTGVALWPRPDDPAGLRVEGAFSGRVVDGDAAEPLPEALVEEVRRLLGRLPPGFVTGGIDLEWGADPRLDGWELTLLQVRPLLPSPAQPPGYMTRGTWVRNTHHHPRALSVFYASVIEATRERAGLTQGAWLGRLYESGGTPRSLVATLPPVPDGPLSGPRALLARQTDRFLRFTRAYLTRRRRHRAGANCVAAVLAAAPAVLTAAPAAPGKNRWSRFCAYFPSAWDPRDRPLEPGELARLSTFGTLTAKGGGSGDPPWRVFDRQVDTREQDDWVFARMLRVLREACLAWGRAATEAGWVREPGDVFLLTLDELTSGLPPTPGLLMRRAALVLAQESWLAPDRVVDGIPERDEGPGPSWEGELTGQGAVPGEAEGVAGGLPGPGEDVAGRIAVVRALTPQDIVFLPGIAGLVVARPGTCGHAVLIARELGIPTVTWAEGCVERIPPGARVRVDGTSGRVRWHQDY